MTTEIKLSKGKVAIVDDEDADLAQYKWQEDGGYAIRSVGSPPKKRKVRMHRVVLERKIGRPLEAGEQVDHINRARHDNRRENLRAASHSDNMLNRPKHGRLSKYKGVTIRAGKWCAVVTGRGPFEYLGLFDTEEEAALAFNEAALKRGYRIEDVNENILMGAALADEYMERWRKWPRS